jgi:hypothetical protein
MDLQNQRLHQGYYRWNRDRPYLLKFERKPPIRPTTGTHWNFADYNLLDALWDLFSITQSPMSEIELQIQGNSTQRKHVDHHPPSTQPASDPVEDTIDIVIELQACSAIIVPTVTKEQARIARIQLFTISWTMFLLGWNDGSVGPLLPRIQEVYRVHKLLPFRHLTDRVVFLLE